MQRTLHWWWGGYSLAFLTLERNRERRLCSWMGVGPARNTTGPDSWEGPVCGIAIHAGKKVAVFTWVKRQPTCPPNLRMAAVDGYKDKDELDDTTTE